MTFEGRSVIRPKLEDRDGAAFQVLLMLKILVGDNQQVESGRLGAIEEIAIADAAPANFRDGRDMMLNKSLTNLNGNRFVEEDFQATSSSIRS